MISLGIICSLDLAYIVTSLTISAINIFVTCIDYIWLSVGSQREADAIYFDLGKASGFVSHSLLLRKAGDWAFWWLCKLFSFTHPI
jgi:hypothetical protein